jgi:microcystin-dependent protein
MGQYIGEIRPFARDLPAGWYPCNGQHLKISENLLLYTVIGTHYGGDGRTTFALPDLRGRATAGVDGRSHHGAGDTSGLGADNASLIPFTVIIWGIADGGTFPSES